MTALPTSAPTRPGRARPVTWLLRQLSRGLVQFLLVVVGLLWLTPAFGLFIGSLRPDEDNAASGWWNALTDPGSLSFEGYSALLENSGIVDSFWNTVLISVPATITVVVVAALAGYAFAWLDFPGRDAIFLVVVGMLVVPVQVGLLPVAKMFGAVGLFGTIPGVVLSTRRLRAAVRRLPAAELLRGDPARDAGGRPDGRRQREWRIFVRLVLPLGRPAIASLAIFQFLWVWNDMLVSLIFADSQSQPLTVALQSEMRQFGSNIGVLAPGAFLSLVVPVAVFFAFQRHFVQGVMAGSVK